MRALMWFRADLRVGDNRALSAATHEAERGVVAVFLIAHEQWRQHDWGGMRVAFLMRNLKTLRDELAELNVPLLVETATTFELAASKLLAVARKHDCEKLFFNREYEVNEVARDEAVGEAFEEDGRGVASYHDQTILPPDAFRTQNGDFYTVFSPFRRAWSAYWEDNLHEAAVVRTARRQAERVCASDDVPDAVPGFDLSVGRPDYWEAGEGAAAERLGRFVEQKIDDYKADRDYPAKPATSVLSPYLALGVISPRQCLERALGSNDGQLETQRKGPTHWISEIIWREFYKHVLVGFPHVCRGRAFKRNTEQIRWNEDEAQFEAWCAGRTGYPIVDAAMKQLNQIGWMHNRLRMVVAMFLTKDLFIDWRWGERYFMNKLVDGDFASNNGGWQWSASTGTDAAPYFRIFNPLSQSTKFDADGEFIVRFLPELGDCDPASLHDLEKLACDPGRPGDYPEPIVDHKAAREHAIAAFKCL